MNNYIIATRYVYIRLVFNIFQPVERLQVAGLVDGSMGRVVEVGTEPRFPVNTYGQAECQNSSQKHKSIARNAFEQLHYYHTA